MDPTFPLSVPPDPEDPPVSQSDDAPDIEGLESLGDDPMGPDPEADALAGSIAQEEQDDVEATIEDAGPDAADDIESGGVAEDPTAGFGDEGEVSSDDVPPDNRSDNSELLQLIAQLEIRVSELEQNSLRWSE